MSTINIKDNHKQKQNDHKEAKQDYKEVEK